MLKAIGVAARLEHGAAISGHSLRVGMAQDMVAADLDVASVMQAGGWASPRMVARYTERLTARRGAVLRQALTERDGSVWWTLSVIILAAIVLVANLTDSTQSPSSKVGALIATLWITAATLFVIRALGG